MLGDRGVVTVFDNRLVVRGSAKDLDSVESLLKQLDVERVMLRVMVRQQQATGEIHSSARINGKSDRSSRTLSAGPSATVRGRYSRSLGNMRHGVEQYVQVLDGEQAYIEIGRQIPYVRFRSYLSGRHRGFSEEVALQEIATGFMVRPRLLGNTVDIEITPRFASENPERDGAIDYRAMTSQVNIPLGEWVDLGGYMETGNDAVKAVLSIRAGENAATGRVWIKVSQEGG
jgi:hypothetical protein